MYRLATNPHITRVSRALGIAIAASTYVVIAAILFI